MTSFPKNITIIDYGTSNLRSVTKAFIKAGANITITSKAKDIEDAERLVLPGVGSFGNGMSMLENLGLIDSLNIFISRGNPLLGICLGMQMLLESSEEDEKKRGLSFIKGKVVKIPVGSDSYISRKIPHIGWSKIDLHKTENRIFSNIDKNDYFYFVHSYMSNPYDETKIIASCNYNEFQVTAAIENSNIIGLQFHPEISGASGLKIIDNFLQLY